MSGKLILCAAVSVLPGLAASQGGITLDSVKGAASSHALVAGEPIEFRLRITNATSDTIEFIGHVFEIYSADGAEWHPRLYFDTSVHATVDTTYYGRWIDPDGSGQLVWKPTIFDGTFYTIANSDEFGEGKDSVWFIGEKQIVGSGIWDGFNQVIWTISLDSITTQSIGKSICVDSSNTFPGVWKWLTSTEEIVPSWDGPHCFEIVADCCEGPRGNINLDLGGSVNISDLTYLVGWMFGEKAAPPCMLEADVNGDSSHNVEDLTHLVSYMFKDGSPPAACP